MENKQDTFEYKGWLNSNSFIKRSLAIVGYNFVGTLILYFIILGIFLLFGTFFWLAGLI